MPPVYRPCGATCRICAARYRLLSETRIAMASSGRALAANRRADFSEMPQRSAILRTESADRGRPPPCRLRGLIAPPSIIKNRGRKQKGWGSCGSYHLSVVHIYDIFLTYLVQVWTTTSRWTKRVSPISHWSKVTIVVRCPRIHFFGFDVREMLMGLNPGPGISDHRDFAALPDQQNRTREIGY
jgi:hypothetical protein